MYELATGDVEVPKMSYATTGVAGVELKYVPVKVTCMTPVDKSALRLLPLGTDPRVPMVMVPAVTTGWA